MDRRTALGMALLAACVSCAFVYGVAVGRYELFPWPQLEAVRGALTNSGAGNEVAPRSSRQKPVDEGLSTTEVSVLTSLLPIRRTTIALRERFDLARKNGGIASYGDGVLVSDARGAIIGYDARSGDVRALAVEAVADFERRIRPNETDTHIQVRDLHFAEPDGVLYASYERRTEDALTSQLVVSAIELSPSASTTEAEWRLLFEGDVIGGRSSVNQVGTPGGRLADAGDGRLFLTIGDFALDARISPDGNGYASQHPERRTSAIGVLDPATGAFAPLSRGHRNPMGIVRARSGAIYAVEQGPRGGDELNVIEAGRNYGWPSVSLGTDYATYSWPVNPEQGTHEGFTAPLFAWVPSIATSALLEIEAFHPRWDGDLLVGSLKAGSLYRLRLDSGRVQYVEPIWIGERIRDVEQDARGALYAWTDSGKLIRLDVDHETLTADRYGAITPFPWQLNDCLTCHHLGQTNDLHPAPSLVGVLGRAAGGDPGFARYSTAMRQSGITWTEDRIRAYLRDPQGVVPGTSMSIAPITDPAQLDRVIEGLNGI